MKGDANKDKELTSFREKENSLNKLLINKRRYISNINDLIISASQIWDFFIGFYSESNLS
ncbi:hypothetical protein BAX96_05085 [Elizabethkingia anophelis]|nr:hypothetical protein BAX96_05085 [Elizabethkingia anophelis]